MKNKAALCSNSVSGIISSMLLSLFCLPFTAHAAVITIPQTGQTVCYDATNTPTACAGTGQDGETLQGASWPGPRFTVNPDTAYEWSVVTDNLSGLVWTKVATAPDNIDCDGGTTGCSSTTIGLRGVCLNGNFGLMSWQEALDYVACLNGAAAYGHNDWRLPNITELEGLLHAGEPDTSAWLETQGFSTGTVQPGSYWSSTSNINTNYNAWVVDLGSDFVWYDDKTLTYDVWPVRGTSPGLFQVNSLPATGQAACYDEAGAAIPDCTGTGQDGEFQKGVAWPVPRFVPNNGFPDNGDTVTDNLSGLTWPGDASTPTIGSCSGGAMNWQGALAYVACLNTAVYAGHDDWRLPNRKELSTLFQYGQDNGTWLAAQGFQSLEDVYWSSTTDSFLTDSAWLVSLQAGDRYSDLKDDPLVSNFVLPVRGGSGLYGSPLGPGLPGSYTFSTAVAAGYSSSPMQFTITNTGTNLLFVNLIAVSGTNSERFSVTNDLCSNTAVAANGNCTFDVTFAPDAAGPFSAVAEVTSNLSTVNLQLSGTGGPSCSYNTYSPVWIGYQDYPTIAAAYQSLSGNATLDIYGTSITGDLQFSDPLKPYEVTLKGGYDCQFSGQAGHTTVLGNVTVAAGTVIMDKIIIQNP